MTSAENNGIANSAEKTARRLGHLQEFYELLDFLIARRGPLRPLGQIENKPAWPSHGVYFFFETSECRSNSGQGLRVVRVGTHALKASVKSTLRSRIANHQGSLKTGVGSHRSSAFRLLVGSALINRDQILVETWGDRKIPPARRDKAEHEIELRVSDVLAQMPVLCLAAANPEDRENIEKNSIGLLSNTANAAILDQQSKDWLGKLCDYQSVKMSGLWNRDFVNDGYDPSFLRRLREIIESEN